MASLPGNPVGKPLSGFVNVLKFRKIKYEKNVNYKDYTGSIKAPIADNQSF